MAGELIAQLKRRVWCFDNPIYLGQNADAPYIRSGDGDPNSAHDGPKGSLFIQKDGATTLWKKSSDNGITTGWGVVGGGGGGSSAWGGITGTLSAQTDLQTALDGKEAAGAVAAHAAAGNPHPVYLTQPEGDALYAALSAPAAAVAAHEAAGDPHPQYLTPSEGNALYQGGDSTLTALAGLSSVAGLVEQTGVDTFTKRAIGVAASTDILTRSDGDGRFAAISHTHTASQISDSTAAGRSMLTAADAAAQTALLNTFTSALKGLAPASGGGTTNFLRADGTWAAAGGGGSPAGVLDDLQISALNADFTLSNASGVQTAFSSAQDVFTVAANSAYSVRGQLYINTGATTHTTALAWALGGGASVASFEYMVLLWSAAANAVATTQSTTHVTGVASKVINATSTAAWTLITFEGILRTTNGGTITPQINFSAAPGGTNLMKRGSWISMSRLGADTFTLAGGWA